jgi:hypothetical protein
MSINTLDNNKLTFVKPLSQNDLADEWRLVVPRIKRQNTTDMNQKYLNNIYRSKVTLCQLPRHLWCKRKNLRNGNIRITEKSHYYYVDKTNVDDEIITLERILSNPYDILYKEKVNELLEVIKDNNITGWVTLKASRLYE